MTASLSARAQQSFAQGLLAGPRSAGVLVGRQRKHHHSTAGVVSCNFTTSPRPVYARHTTPFQPSSLLRTACAYPAVATPSGLSSCYFSSKAADDVEKKDEEDAGGAQKAPSPEEDSTAPPGETSQQEQDAKSPTREEELEAEIKSLKDQLLRSLAEQDNTRRIAQRDVESARQFAIKSFAKSMLDVSDNLIRALEAVPRDEIDNSQGSTLGTLYEGIEMTERGLSKAFEMHGLVRYGEEGEAFDPNRHEALYEYPDPSGQPGTIGKVIKTGFMLNKRVLRPAEVGVIKKES